MEPAADSKMARTLAREWIRSARGRHPQKELSHALGYRSNILYRWEAGLCVPSASAFFRLLDATGVDISASILRFFPTVPDQLATLDMKSPQGIMELLREMRGKLTLKELSKRLGVSRFTIGRWLSGDAQPRLPELIAFVANTTLRLLDFIACSTNPDTLPSIRVEWRRLQRARSLAYDLPWSHAVLRVLELDQYRHLPQHQPGWIARQLGISASDESRCLELLTQTGQVVWSETHCRPSSTGLVDTRTDPQGAQRLKAWWLLVGLEKLKTGVAGVYSYNLGAVSREDLARIQQLQRSFYRQMTQIIANSESPECLLLYCAQLVDLAQPESTGLLYSETSG